MRSITVSRAVRVARRTVVGTNNLVEVIGGHKPMTVEDVVGGRHVELDHDAY
jgi:hypothetical protein